MIFVMVKISYPYTYCHTSTNSKSYIDFILLGNSAKKAFCEYSIQDFPLNLSDHLSVCLQFNLDLMKDRPTADRPTADRPTAGSFENNTHIAEKDNDNNLMWGLRWDHCNLSLYYELTRINIDSILENINRYTDSCDNGHYHDNCV